MCSGLQLAENKSKVREPISVQAANVEASTFLSNRFLRVAEIKDCPFQTFRKFAALSIESADRIESDLSLVTKIVWMSQKPKLPVSN